MHAVKRVYAGAEDGDGFRVLVDRLWPRGLSREKACLDLWFRDAAPSNELRKWFGHDPAKWEEFRDRYQKELRGNPEAVGELKRALKGRRKVTLLYGARDEEHNEAVVLRDFLERRPD